MSVPALLPPQPVPGGLPALGGGAGVPALGLPGAAVRGAAGVRAGDCPPAPLRPGQRHRVAGHRVHHLRPLPHHPPGGHRARPWGTRVLQARGRPHVTALWPPLGPEGTGSCATSCLPSQEKLLEENYSPVMMAKAVKNAHEQEILRAAHVRAVPLPTVLCRLGANQRKQGADAPSPVPPGTPRSGTRWPSSSTCCGWRRQSHRGRWTSFWGLSTSMHFAGQCWPPSLPCPAKGSRGPPAPPCLPAAFQGPGAQPRAQLPVHLGQRAQRGAGPLQVWLGQCWAVGRGRWAMGSWERALTPLPSQPLQREQPDAVCG